jgi:low affinity Fe/Cu permease
MDYDMTIHHNPDAVAWAKFFIETTKDMERDVFSDEGYMITWFANAMMAMHDHLYVTEIVRRQNEAANEIERLRNKQDAEIELYRKILQQIADEASGHGQALAYAALKEKE